MKLFDLIQSCPYVTETRGEDREIDLMMMDSRKDMPNGLFFCISGTRTDGHQFAPQAVKNGAVALVVERPLDLPVTQVVVTDTRPAMARMAAAFYGHPANDIHLLGITGTKGKTTTSFLVHSILKEAGIKAGLIGTTGYMIGDEWLKGELTTPDPIDMHATLRKMADAGVRAAVMEVSAHALALGKMDGMQFDVGCFTNLSQDHLDFFGTMENYFEAKKKFFTGGYIRNAVINADVDQAAALAESIDVPLRRFGICRTADVFARDIEITEDGVHFTLKLNGYGDMPVRMHLTGMFNIYNAMAAASMALTLGIAPEHIIAGLENLTAVPGRAEVLQTRTSYKIILDYSHSPDALSNILTTVRGFARGRVISVFGCGGDRDHLKRPIMGEISGRLADFSILTSDNPRTEDPYDILHAVEEGIQRTQGQYTVIENRREAIRYAMNMAKSGDIIVLAGKGHETYQEINGIKRPFDEKVVVSQLLNEARA